MRLGPNREFEGLTIHRTATLIPANAGSGRGEGRGAPNNYRVVQALKLWRGKIPSVSGLAEAKKRRPGPNTLLASADTPRPIWGFVSITNNQTQEITLVTPQVSGVAVAPDKIPSGWWTGGSLISVDETDAKVYFGCYVGTFKTPSLDTDGRFKTTGLVFGGAGPPPLGGDQTAMDFEGRVADGWLTVTIRTGSRVFATVRGQFVGPQQPGPIPPPCP